MKIREVKPGFEKEIESFLLKKDALEAEKKVAIDEAIKKVNEEFIERENVVISILNLMTREVEIPDTEVPETSTPGQELTETVENAVVGESDCTVDEKVKETEQETITNPTATIATPSHVRFN